MLGAHRARARRAITHLAPGADVASTVACLRALGVAHRRARRRAPFAIHGRGRAGLRAAGRAARRRQFRHDACGCWPGSSPAGRFDARSSATSRCRRRPMRRVIDPLTAMGARIDVDRRPRAARHRRRRRSRPSTGARPVASAQVKSAIMLAGLGAQRHHDRSLEPLATRDHTERAFPAFGLRRRRDGRARSSSRATGGQERRSRPPARSRCPATRRRRRSGRPRRRRCPARRVEHRRASASIRAGSASSARSSAWARAIDDRSHRTRSAASRSARSTSRTTAIAPTRRLAPTRCPSLIDELPVLAARAALGGSLEVSGAGELRVKESDRITALVDRLARAGRRRRRAARRLRDRRTRRPTGGTADAAGDHRLVMAFALVALGATGPSTITGADAVAVSYPDFARDLREAASQ